MVGFYRPNAWNCFSRYLAQFIEAPGSPYAGRLSTMSPAMPGNSVFNLSRNGDCFNFARGRSANLYGGDLQYALVTSAQAMAPSVKLVRAPHRILSSQPLTLGR